MNLVLLTHPFLFNIEERTTALEELMVSPCAPETAVPVQFKRKASLQALENLPIRKVASGVEGEQRESRVAKSHVGSSCTCPHCHPFLHKAEANSSIEGAKEEGGETCLAPATWLVTILCVSKSDGIKAGMPRYQEVNF